MTSWSPRRCLKFATAGTVSLLTLSACATASAAEHKQMILLHSFGREFKPWSEYAKTIRTELHRQASFPLDITEHSLLTARTSDDKPEGAFVEYLKALHTTRRLDLVVGLGAPAVAFVQQYRQQLFPNTPMIFTAVQQRRVQ